jgi:hypothetical protein
MTLNFSGLRLGEAFPNLGFWLAVLAFFGVGTLAAMQYSAPKPMRFGMVDLASIMSAREQEFSALVLKKDATDADRGKAHDLVKKTSEDLKLALAQIQSSCQCSVLIAGAVVTTQKDLLVDYTPQLKTMMGLKP